MPTMSKVLITEQTLKDLAAKIRGKTGKTDKLTPSKMVGEIDDIGGLDWMALGYSGPPEWLVGYYNVAVEVSKCNTTKEYIDKDLNDKEYQVLNFDVTFEQANVRPVFSKSIIEIKKCIIFHDGAPLSWADMFANCNNLEKVEKIKLSGFGTIAGLFSNCIKLKNIVSIDIGDCDTIGGDSYSRGMFNRCTRLTTVPLFDTSKVKHMGHMFYECTSLTTVPLFDTSNVTNMNGMFKNCTRLTTVPLFDTSNVTNMSDMFINCTGLTTVPLFNTSNSTSFFQMFAECRNLVTAPSFSTKKSYNFNNMFRNCVKLENVPIYDMSGLAYQSFQNMFSNCTKLTDESLDNILVSLISASNAQSGTGVDNKKLSYVGFIATYYPASRIQALPHYQDFLDAGWTIGY